MNPSSPDQGDSLLADIADAPRYVAETYTPVSVLLRLGYAVFVDGRYSTALTITSEGRAALAGDLT